ncbi:hypothetical protein GTP45_12405 [Pseudoduganella sp. FT55W]|uniref:MSHA biogenesis protein MshI n=1 Tax=Duganella rivi TaxID=2666083 RepID=A0A7X4KBY8_9BURK|nr:hypothetical protein [Duganella rivi]MYM67630.1 hypothetical protein [Duganella rivi]
MSQQINLFNPIFLKQKKIFTALPMAEALGAIVMGALLLNWYAVQSVKELEKEAASGKALLAKSEQHLTAARAQFVPRPQSPALAAEVVQAEAELKALHDVSSVLQGGELGNTAGYAEYFRAFSRQNVSGLWLTGVSINGAGNDIGVQGRAMQATLIPNYIARLTAERVMRGKTFASLDISRPEGTASAAAPSAAPASAATASPFVEFSLQSTMKEAAK